MSIETNKKLRIIGLRAEGKSYAYIAREVGVSKQTAIDTAKEAEEQIATLRALEVEEFLETAKIGKEERLRGFADLMSRVRDEIQNRDLEDIPTDRLIDLYIKLNSSLKEEIVEPKFQSTEEQEQDRKEREAFENMFS